MIKSGVQYFQIYPWLFQNPSWEYEYNQNSFFTLITFLRYLTSFTISKFPIFETHLSPTMAPSVLFFKKERNKIFRVIGLFTKELPCHLSFRLNGVFLPTENNSDISHYKPPLLHYVNIIAKLVVSFVILFFSTALQRVAAAQYRGK